MNNSGYGNVFLGFNAGYKETSSNKLYVDNSPDTFPLIYGDFNEGLVAVNGKLGIGIQTPSYPIYVLTREAPARIILDRAHGAKGYATADVSAVCFGSLNEYPLCLVVNDEKKMWLKSNNSLILRNGAKCTPGGKWTDSSSRRLKENIRELTTKDALEVLEELAPVRFNDKADKTEECLGFIAEDAPALVATSERDGISPMDIVAVLTKVVQEQQKTNDELRKMIGELRAEIEALKQHGR